MLMPNRISLSKEAQMSDQKLTIETQPAPGGVPPAPRLELAGYWLEDAGFPVGARVEVEVVEPGRLVMTRQDLEGPLPNLLPLVWVPVDRLASIEEAREAAEAARG
jgi:Toxin SymE, type I toxin-antitoxin system